MTLGSSHIEQLIAFRRKLHQHPEISGQEVNTAYLIKQFLESFHPAKIVDKLGGHGLVVVYTGEKPGKTILIRGDMDALPIDENLDLAHSSINSGVSHKCGHDGHTAILCGVAMMLSMVPLQQGRVILLFQPAEETGQGAFNVLHDQLFGSLKPDFCFALHNLPGFPLGSIVIKQGAFAAASKGCVVKFQGTTSHAGEPHKGINPGLAMAQLIQLFNGVPQSYTSFNDLTKVTIVHAQLGKQAFGTSPGFAVIMSTLRAAFDEVLETLESKCRHLARGIADTHNLKVQFSTTESFPSTVNSSEAVRKVLKAARYEKMKIINLDQTFAWSEDFGHFTNLYPGSLFGLGAGKDQPALHNPDYDFPDSLIVKGIDIFNRIIRQFHLG